ncbi:MAG: M23 family metallopeptidase [Gammaproteobacteria bacterium]
MKPLVRPWRRWASAGRLLGVLAALAVAPAWAQLPRGDATVRELLAPAASLVAPVGGARTPREWPRSLSTAPPGAWMASMTRQDIRLGRVDAHHDDAYTYRLPYGEGVSYPIIQGYGAKLSHVGAEQFTLDFGMPMGTPVHAARDGVVVLFEDSHDGGCLRDECSRLSNFIVVLHADGTTGEYFHLQRGSVRVALGDRIERGQLLALSGNTGYSSAPHLHFGVYRTLLDGHTQSVAVRFETRLGAIVAPRGGARYVNIAEH